MSIRFICRQVDFNEAAHVGNVPTFTTMHTFIDAKALEEWLRFVGERRIDQSFCRRELTGIELMDAT